MVERFTRGLLVSQKRWDDNGTPLLTMGEANPPRPNTPKPVVTENPDDKPNKRAWLPPHCRVTTRLNAVYQEVQRYRQGGLWRADQRLGHLGVPGMISLIPSAAAA